MEADNNVECIKFSNFEKSLLLHYVKFNANLSRCFVEAKKAKNNSPKKDGPKFSEDAEEKEKGLKILQLFKDTIEKKILSFIPAKPIYKPDKVIIY